jgi:DNA polymerase mu
MERYYDVPQGIDATELNIPGSPIFTPNGQLIPQRNVKNDGGIPQITIKAALAHRKDLNEPIPRSEVEEMHQVTMAELEEIQTGCKSTIVGGLAGI